MGQRLNIEIIKNSKTLANAYYHWSAYSKESAEMARKIVYAIPNIKEGNDLLYAIRLLEYTGAAFNDDELTYAKTISSLKDSAFNECAGRNNGLISISENGINKTRMWQEGAVYIYLDEDRIGYKVYWVKDRWDWERDEKEEHDNPVEFKDLEVVDVNFDDIKFSNIDSFVDFVNSHLENDFVTTQESFKVYSMIY